MRFISFFVLVVCQGRSEMVANETEFHLTKFCSVEKYKLAFIVLTGNFSVHMCKFLGRIHEHAERAYNKNPSKTANDGELLWTNAEAIINFAVFFFFSLSLLFSLNRCVEKIEGGEGGGVGFGIYDYSPKAIWIFG